MRLLFSLVLALVVATPLQVLAWGAGGQTFGANKGFSRSTTSQAVRNLTEGVATCHKLGWAYRYDCYSKTYGNVARDLERNSAYADAAQALRDVETRLNETIDRNVDSSKPEIRQQGQTYRAIRKESVAQAKREFLSALDDAETKLLRSPDDGDAHFARIAQAINTNKLLLRSALLGAPQAFRVAGAMIYEQIAGLARS
ncbi:hypothetical protein GI582_01910 [Sulfitobacter sp. BDSS02]|nr:hypothetical protein [Sulfitobacter sp. BDSS02]MBR9847901.1 hypothetical protein [Paracoccaceae bacterium]